MAMPFTVNWFIPVRHTNYDDMSASIWIRCLQLLPYLEERGVRCTVNDARSRAPINVFVRWQDKKAYKLARRVKKGGGRIAFDLCVNYFDESGLFKGEFGVYGTTAERVEECRRFADVADVIICGSEFIRQRASQVHPHTIYLPESVDQRHFCHAKPKEDFQRSTLTAVWCGQPSKADELATIYPLLAERQMPLLVISARKPRLPGPFTYVPWSYSTFPRAMLQGDLCVTPRRTGNPYDLGHSHFKIGVFMAQGIPALASPLPSYREVIHATGGGRICDSDGAWKSALDEAMAERHSVQTWSRAAREGMAAYATDAVVNQYVTLFETLLDTAH